MSDTLILLALPLSEILKKEVNTTVFILRWKEYGGVQSGGCLQTRLQVQNAFFNINIGTSRASSDFARPYVF